MKLPLPASARAAVANAVTSAVRPVGGALRDRRPGPDASLARRPNLDVPATITLTSPAFADGDEIPARFCGIGIGEGLSPALDWAGVPEGTERLLLVLEDLDAPLADRALIHAAAVLDARGGEGSLAEGAFTPRNRRLAWVRAARGPLGRAYRAPRPLPGHGEHRYVFHVFAIDTPITPPADADLDTLVRALVGRVTARGELTGTRGA
ncbi:YbhB/YbcL family Raf kinase inhibitor-like protein [Brachybacterium huguangmaarense]